MMMRESYGYPAPPEAHPSPASNRCLLLRNNPVPPPEMWELARSEASSLSESDPGMVIVLSEAGVSDHAEANNVTSGKLSLSNAQVSSASRHSEWNRVVC